MGKKLVSTLLRDWPSEKSWNVDENCNLTQSNPSFGHTSISDRVAELRCVTASFTSEHTLIFNGRKISYKFPINDDSVTITYSGHQKIKNHRKVDVF